MQDSGERFDEGVELWACDESAEDVGVLSHGLGAVKCAASA